MTQRANAGGLRLSTLLWLALLAAGTYAGYQVLPLWIRFYSFQQFIDEKAQTAQLSRDAVIQQDVLARAAELGIALDASDVAVEYIEDGITITASWTDAVTLLGVYDQEFPRRIEIHRQSVRR